MQTPDAFDHWLDQALRDLFAQYPGKVLPPELQALLEPEPKPSERKPPTPKPE